MMNPQFLMRAVILITGGASWLSNCGRQQHTKTAAAEKVILSQAAETLLCLLLYVAMCRAPRFIEIAVPHSRNQKTRA
jgi:hypothetical protein